MYKFNIYFFTRVHLVLGIQRSQKQTKIDFFLMCLLIFVNIVTVWITSYTVQPRKHHHGTVAAGLGLHCQEQNFKNISGVSFLQFKFIKKINI